MLPILGAASGRAEAPQAFAIYGQLRFYDALDAGDRATP